MASELSNYLADAFLNYFKGVDLPAAPATVYIGLFDGDPTATGTGGTEVTETIRPAGRVAVAWGAVTAREISNTAPVNFGEAAEAATVTHSALFDAAAGGNMLTYSPLDEARTIAAGDPAVIPLGNAVVDFI